MDDLLGRARAAWANYAGIDGGFRPGLVNLGVNARSRICPPGWAGIVLLGNAAIVTAPAAGAERDLRRALSGVPMDQQTPELQVPVKCAHRQAQVLPMCTSIGSRGLMRAAGQPGFPAICLYCRNRASQRPFDGGLERAAVAWQRRTR